MSLEGYKFSQEHEWAVNEENVVTIGITEHASEELGEIVFVELPEVGTEVKQGDELGTIESVKTVSSLYAPLSGKVVEVNTDLEDQAANINEEPYGDGWIAKIEIENTDEWNDLLSEDDYNTYLENL